MVTVRTAGGGGGAIKADVWLLVLELDLLERDEEEDDDDDEEDR